MSKSHVGSSHLVLQTSYGVLFPVPQDLMSRSVPGESQFAAEILPGATQKAPSREQAL